MLVITEKVPGGKLVRIKVSLDNNEIKNIQITGDFFMHPESGVEILEQQLQNTKITNIKKKIDETVAAHNIQIIGFTSDDIARMVQSTEVKP